MVDELEQKFETIIQKLRSDLALVRTGRASSALVENLKVPVYGSVMTLKELASISIPEPRQILITPWDKSVISDVENALRSQNFSPAVEETIIRIALPPLTGEEREKIMKEVGIKAEESKVSLRQARREEVERIESAEDRKEISEDEEFSQKKKIDEVLAHYQRKIDESSQEKRSQLEIQ
jgi:ribosome recycling factor